MVRGKISTDQKENALRRLRKEFTKFPNVKADTINKFVDDMKQNDNVSNMNSNLLCTAYLFVEHNRDKTLINNLTIDSYISSYSPIIFQSDNPSEEMIVKARCGLLRYILFLYDFYKLDRSII